MPYWLDDTYCVKIDRYNHTLKKKVITKKGDNKGQERFVDVGYYNNINGAVRKWIDLRVSSEADETAYDLIDKYDELISEVNSRWEP